MIRRSYIAGVLLLLCSWLPGPGNASASSADLSTVISQIETAYQQIDDLQANFIQQTTYEGFSTPYTSEGRLYIQRPGQMRWDYQQPSKHQIYVNDDEVIYVVPEHLQAIRSTLQQEARSPLPLLLLSGAARLSDHFTIDWAHEKPTSDGRHQLRLTGKGAAASLMPLSIEVNDTSHLIHHVILHDPSGSTTTFEFSEITINGGVDAALFIFTLGDGIELIDAPPVLAPAPAPAMPVEQEQ